MDIQAESLAEWTQAFADACRQSQYDMSFVELLAKREPPRIDSVGRDASILLKKSMRKFVT